MLSNPFVCYFPYDMTGDENQLIILLNITNILISIYLSYVEISLLLERLLVVNWDFPCMRHIGHNRDNENFPCHYTQ